MWCVVRRWKRKKQRGAAFREKTISSLTQKWGSGRPHARHSAACGRTERDTEVGGEDHWRQYVSMRKGRNTPERYRRRRDHETRSSGGLRGRHQGANVFLALVLVSTSKLSLRFHRPAPPEARARHNDVLAHCRPGPRAEKAGARRARHHEAFSSPSRGMCSGRFEHRPADPSTSGRPAGLQNSYMGPENLQSTCTAGLKTLTRWTAAGHMYCSSNDTLSSLRQRPWPGGVDVLQRTAAALSPDRVRPQHHRRGDKITRQRWSGVPCDHHRRFTAISGKWPHSVSVAGWQQASTAHMTPDDRDDPAMSATDIYVARGCCFGDQLTASEIVAPAHGRDDRRARVEWHRQARWGDFVWEALLC